MIEFAPVILGLVTGVLLGLAARLGNFCSLGAIEDVMYGGRYYRLLMWPSAFGAAAIIVGLSMLLGKFDPAAAFYLQTAPNYLAHIFGGLLFGWGMALSGGCGFTALAKIGSGDLRALVLVIILGVSAYAISSGVLSPIRTRFFIYAQSETPTSFAYMATNPAWVYLSIGVFASLLPLIRRNYRNSVSPLWALLVGFAIAVSFIGTYTIAMLSFVDIPVESHTFSLPPGESLLYIMASSGMSLNFGIGSVFGVIIGGFIGSAFRGRFRFEACDDPRELARQMAGASFMGVGAVIALGCSIGQGLSAMSLLYFGAPVTLLSIAIGAYFGLRRLVEG